MEKNYLDKKIPLAERKKLYKIALEKMLNPFKVFNPKNFEPLASPDQKQVAFRKRVKPPKELPTFGLEPKEILIGQMIGMYESKQDLYLIMAYRMNEMQTEMEELKEEVTKLKSG